jgi:CBS-domain-containing membrane protein
MLVAEWMSRDVATVAPEESVSTAARLLGKRRIRQVPVVEGDNVLCGLVTKSDLLRACPPDLNPFSLIGSIDLPRPVREIMTKETITTRQDSPLEEAAHQLIECRINALPVISSSLRLIGILTGSDICRALLAALGAGSLGVRITFDIKANEDVFGLVTALASKHDARLQSVTNFEHEGRHTAIVRLEDERVGLVDELWQTGHSVSSVARFK